MLGFIKQPHMIFLANLIVYVQDVAVASYGRQEKFSGEKFGFQQICSIYFHAYLHDYWLTRKPPKQT